MNNKGQLSIIAALLLAVILITTVMVTYSTILNSQMQDQPQLLSAIDETNLAIKGVLGYTVGYYGSVLQVTADASYADMLATNYLQSGFDNIANMHPEWAASFNLSSKYIHTYSFTDTSYCIGNLTVGYDLVGLGISGVKYQTACKLQVNVENSTSGNQARLTVTKDEGEPLINLGKQNFKFYNYTYSNSMWNFINPNNIQAAFANGTYVIDTPNGIDPRFYVVQVEDSRGLIVTASSFNHYTYNLTWNSTFYSNLQNAPIVVEVLQNGTMRWLGQNLTTQSTPMPPLPTKSIHVNQTINNINQEIPFQIEDWESEYKVPLGLTNNASLFTKNNMIVFLVNNNANTNVSKIKVWWDGSDIATQTQYSIYNSTTSPFKNCTPGKLSNGNITLSITGSPIFTINSAALGGNVNCTATFFRVNTQDTHIGSSESYPILKGVVRDIAHQEAEWQGGISQCPNVYSQIIITLPAYTTYYTYQLRLMFMNSAQKRNVTDLCPVKLVAVNGSAVTQVTENGTDVNGYPIPAISKQTDVFSNYASPSLTPHHWSQFNSTTGAGAGIMFTDNANKLLYYFDSVANNQTGALRINAISKTIELQPVALVPANFTTSLDITWNGAITTSAGSMTPIYTDSSGTKTGLWILVEHPPTINVSVEN